MSEFNDRFPLEPLDPGSKDPGFWLRFHARVMDQARAELQRRRMAMELSVVEVVFAWRRALVPMALLAAALAGILLMDSARQAPVEVVALEDVLTEGLNLSPISAVMTGEGASQTGVGIFAAVEGGF
jgi:hypothetical protein